MVLSEATAATAAFEPGGGEATRLPVGLRVIVMDGDLAPMRRRTDTSTMVRSRMMWMFKHSEVAAGVVVAAGLPAQGRARYLVRLDRADMAEALGADAVGGTRENPEVVVPATRLLLWDITEAMEDRRVADLCGELHSLLITNEARVEGIILGTVVALRDGFPFSLTNDAGEIRRAFAALDELCPGINWGEVAMRAPMTVRSLNDSPLVASTVSAVLRRWTMAEFMAVLHRSPNLILLGAEQVGRAFEVLAETGMTDDQVIGLSYDSSARCLSHPEHVVAVFDVLTEFMRPERARQCMSKLGFTLKLSTDLVRSCLTVVAEKFPDREELADVVESYPYVAKRAAARYHREHFFAAVRKIHHGSAIGWGVMVTETAGDLERSYPGFKAWDSAYKASVAAGAPPPDPALFWNPHAEEEMRGFGGARG